MPALRWNLISVGCFTNQQHVLIFEDNCFFVLDNKYNKRVIAVGDCDHTSGLYKLQTANLMAHLAQDINPEGAHQIHHSSPALYIVSPQILLWYKCFGHLHHIGLLHLSIHKRVWGLPHLGGPGEICGACMARKQRHKRFPKVSTNRSTKTLHFIHSNLVGPLSVTSLGQSRYFVVFTVDYSHKS